MWRGMYLCEEEFGNRGNILFSCINKKFVNASNRIIRLRLENSYSSYIYICHVIEMLIYFEES
jgi:hypothetical protein